MALTLVEYTDDQRRKDTLVLLVGFHLGIVAMPGAPQSVDAAEAAMPAGKHPRYNIGVRGLLYSLGYVLQMQPPAFGKSRPIFHLDASSQTAEIGAPAV